MWRFSLALFSLTTFSGCASFGYLWQAGLGQLSIYSHERPVDEVIKDPHTRDAVRERLLWISDIKKLVEAKLGVKATSNYTTYVELNRPYVVWAVTAARPYDVELVEWSFPVVGKFPYLGFFDESAAQGWAGDYRSKGFDTYVRGVSAYSTLGYLRDPMLSSMLSRQKSDLVNLIFHETTHSQVYLKGQGSFNEQIANLIGDNGEREWLIENFGEKSNELNEWRKEREARSRVASELRSFSDELKLFYKAIAGLAESEKIRKKAERFSAAKKRFEKIDGRFAKFLSRKLDNNAVLLALLTYEDEQPLFEALYSKCGQSVRRTLDFLRDFQKKLESSPDQKASSPQEVLKRELSELKC